LNTLSTLFADVLCLHHFEVLDDLGKFFQYPKERGKSTKQTKQASKQKIQQIKPVIFPAQLRNSCPLFEITPHNNPI
jgi:hypothetical protein